MTAYDLARFMHERSREYLEPTRLILTPVWDQLPAGARKVMIEVAGDVLRKLEVDHG